MKGRTKISAYVAAIAAAIFAVVAVTINVTVDEKGKPQVSIKIGPRANPNVPVVYADRDAALEEHEQADAGDPTPADVGPGIHEDARDETPPNAPQDAQHRLAEQPANGLQEPQPVGGAQSVSCAKHLVSNRSSRRGAKVELLVLHYTVSRPGSIQVIRRLFNTPSFNASSTYGFELSGVCELWVPENEKPWTQMTFNPVSVSIEIIAMGNESRSWWLSQPAFKKGLLAALSADILRRHGLPPRRVDPAGCNVQQAGWTDHASLECGNTHHDVSPNFPYDVFQRQLYAHFQGQATVTLLPCTPINIERALAKRYPKMKIVVDGKIGDRSRAAIRRVQREKGFSTNGRVGPLTGKALGLENCQR